jgi:hypothetical protein
MNMRKAIAASAAAALGTAGLAMGVGPLAFGAGNATTCNNGVSLNPGSANCSGGSGDSGNLNQTPTGQNNGGNANITTGNTSALVGSVAVSKGSSHSMTSVKSSQGQQGTAKANGKTGKTGNTGDGQNFKA